MCLDLLGGQVSCSEGAGRDPGRRALTLTVFPLISGWALAIALGYAEGIHHPHPQHQPSLS